MEKKVLMFVADGSESTELIATYDILNRAAINVTLMGKDSSILHREDKLKVESLKNYKFSEYDAIIFPGGRLGVDNVTFLLENNPDKLLELVKFFESGKLVAAICAAPSILGKFGLLQGKNFTCYPGFEGENHYLGNYTKDKITVDGNLITGRSMYYTADFALEVVEYLLGKQERNRVENQIKGIH